MTVAETEELEPPRLRYEPSRCPCCEEEEQRGWIGMEPCQECNPDGEYPP